MVDDIVIYASVALSAATLVLLVVLFLRLQSLITKKVAEVAAKVEQTGGAVMAGVSDLASRPQVIPPPTAEVGPVQQEPGQVSMEGGLGAQVGPRPAGVGPVVSGGEVGALQPGRRYKYVLDPVTRKMRLVPAD